MKASQIQQQLKLNADVLTGLHEEYTKLRKARKEFNAFADEYEEKGEDALAKDYSEQAAIFTPYIKKFKRKIASLEKIQVTLKHELRCSQCLEIWAEEDEAFWAERVFDDRHVVGLAEIEEMFRGDA